jgi:hypothetical protein
MTSQVCRKNPGQIMNGLRGNMEETNAIILQHLENKRITTNTEFIGARPRSAVSTQPESAVLSPHLAPHVSGFCLHTCLQHPLAISKIEYLRVLKLSL